MLLRFALIGLIVTGFFLASDAIPWALAQIGREDQVAFLDALLMPALILFVLLTIWGLVQKFGR
ncbi:MAG: hypothetical protein RIB45_02825 [Marivibrio sp.]|uniref:hypothetical protein n=1 Tax=Marivibrio sp. TaxID=2039719 RepID=UPI0032ECEACD